jgi:scyllo-inositol 2-dehydrogenase (NADP+)
MDLTSCFDRYKPTSPSADLWKERGGEYNDALYNLGSHMIDQALVLFGKPSRIICRSWPQRGVEGLDEAVSTPSDWRWIRRGVRRI